MSQHLSSEQISELLIGAGEPAAARHAQECPACRSQVEALSQPLMAFRESVHRLGERHGARRLETTQVFFLMPESIDRRSKAASGLSSLLIHCGVIAMLVALGSAKPVQKLIRDTTMLVAPDLRPYIAAAKKDRSGGGGGGGTRALLDASKGKLPKPAPRQFTPPRVDPIENPKLPMTPTIVGPDNVPNIQANAYGDPLGRLGIPSNGTGIGGGIGSGKGGGVGPGNGPGAGPGSGGGFGGGAFRIGGGVTAPTVLVKVEPEYSEEARKAKWQGTVVLALVVDENGTAQAIKVTKSLGLGLDQKAIEAVQKWRFKPGMKDGKPVPVIASVEVNFRLL